jgi:hypothetical protein
MRRTTISAATTVPPTTVRAEGDDTDSGHEATVESADPSGHYRDQPANSRP